MIIESSLLRSTANTSRSPRDHALFERARQALARLYGNRPDIDFGALMAEIGARLEAAAGARPPALRALDDTRRDDPRWFAKAGRPAYCTYIDRFSGTLQGCIDHIPYLEDLGVGLFHPLPLLKPRDGDNDGGFAVADYRAVDPRLGTFDDLKSLADALRARDMSLVLDVVCNHTAREHAWARGMVAGDSAYKDFYIVLGDEAEKDAWARPLSDVFPDTAPGSFTYDAEAGGWVWTTFYPFQWDLNYANPRVFIAMLDVLFDLANAGVEGFRLDSAAYLWKIKGTICRNLPQAHAILLAWRSLLSIVAPGVFLLAEAIEGLDEVLGYFGDDDAHSECDLAYNNTMMTALWGSLADGDAQTARTALDLTAAKPAHGTWLNYVRCHDDIIWQAVSTWVDQDRLQTWSDFYAGENASFADGRAFQAPAGLARSTCGMAASLCGIGQAEGQKEGHKEGLQRLELLYAVTCALDGVPMIYMGDEIALANDDDFANDPEKAAELRWLHRPAMDWQAAGNRGTPDTVQHVMFAYLNSLQAIQHSMPGWRDGGPALAVPSADPRLLVFTRQVGDRTFTCTANFSAATVYRPDGGEGYDLISRRTISTLAPYQVIWTLDA